MSDQNIMEHYTLGKLLGRGAWGRVYFASRLDSKVELALKQIDYEQQSEAERKATLLEVRLLARLQHRYITGGC